ncbi:hypothetical protein [Bacillus subtilis]|uniref:hypothetical protein n=1 Tax=Bacillus subtilis TaxID=1423 RepID=UPI00227FEE47|nr:hypothetical protein [Bacillus spizizenii]MCY8635291.1 hypothetical protein [Bacillus spizizenii]
MAKNEVLSIEDKIKKLKEDRKRALAKLEKTTGKKFLEAFDLYKKPIEEIEELINELKIKYSNDQPEKEENEQVKEESDHVGFTHN